MRKIARLQSKLYCVTDNDKAIQTSLEVTLLLFIGVLIAVALYMLYGYMTEHSQDGLGQKIVNAFQDEKPVIYS